MIKRIFCIALGMILGLSIFAMIPLQSNAAQMQVSDACVQLIKQLEGFTAVPQWDYSQWSVGYGTTCPEEHRERYTKEGIPIAEAEALFAEKMVYFDERVNNFIQKNNLTLTQGQYDAIFSLTYNCGASWLNKSEGTLYQAIVNGVTGNDFVAALSAWCTAGGSFLSGLMSRRLIEVEMYLYGNYSKTLPDYYSYVKYDPNGGVRTAAAQGYDTRYPAKTMATATYEGHTFLGWFTDPNGGTQVTNLDASHNKLTLYAHWAEGSVDGDAIDPVRVTVTADTLNIRAGAGADFEAVAQVNAGAQLDITAVKAVGDSLWGRCSQGWVSLEHTNYGSLSGDQDNSNIGKMFATITASSLNVRKGPGTSYDRVTSLQRGAVVEVLERTLVDGKTWGRYANGWFCITDYAVVKTVTEDGEVTVPDLGESEASPEDTTVPAEPEEEIQIPAAPATVSIIGTQAVVIRNGPHKSYPSKGEYAVGSRVEILEFMSFMGQLWGRSDKGWICIDSAVMQDDDNGLVNTFFITVSSSLYVRTGPGTQNDYVRTVHKGDVLEVYALEDVNGITWGRIYCGWISLKYTNYTPSMVPDQTPKEDCDTQGHKYIDSVISPTCTSSGYTAHTCERCGHRYTDTKVAALGHKYTDKVVAATCTDKGYTAHTCATCGHSYTDSETSALGHSYESEVTAPTSTQQGYTTHTCKTCGHSYTDSYTDALQGGNTTTVTKTYAKLTAGAVNVRKGAGASYGWVTILRRGDKVEILEQQTVDGKVWGRYSGGWFRITGYATLETVTVQGNGSTAQPSTPSVSVPSDKVYATITAGAVNVRKGAGASYGWVTTLRRGDVVEILEQKTVDGKVWGRYSGGWFRLTGYTTLENAGGGDTQTPAQPSSPSQTDGKVYATITVGAVNVRKDAGASSAWVTTLRRGDVVEVLEQKTVDEKVWGRTNKGWFRITGYATLTTK